MEHFEEMQHIADGSNANIFLAKLNGERVVVKMIKSEVQRDPVAVHEFDVEHGMLSRMSHPHVIKLMGAGRLPRRFVVLEYLGGGSLNSILQENQSKGGFAQRLFRRPTFTYANLLSKVRNSPRHYCPTTSLRHCLARPLVQSLSPTPLPASPSP